MFYLHQEATSRRTSLLPVSLWLGWVLLGTACVAEPEPVPPSILLYVSDTLRADGLAAYGNPIDTPVTSRLAHEGVLYREVRAQSSWTRPSIASILSGLAPDVHGVDTRDDELPPAVTLLSEHLQAKGYATACITTNPNVGSFYGFDQGYDAFIELYPRRKRGYIRPEEPRARADVVTRKAIEWLETVEPPFFLFVLTTDPHWPYHPPERFDRYGGDYRGDINGAEDVRSLRPRSEADRERIRSLYYGEIAFNDDALGGIIDYLEARGVYERTIVAFTSDHGEEFWEHERNGHGKNLYDEALKVPLILRYPENLAGAEPQPGARSVDLAPTLLDLLGLSIPEGLDGRSLLRGGVDRPTAYARLQLGKWRGESLVEYPWKLITGNLAPGRARNTEPGPAALYNLETDPGEKSDLAREHPERVRAMLGQLAERAERNRTRRDAVRQGTADDERAVVPEDVQDALDALGYLETAEE